MWVVELPVYRRPDLSAPSAAMAEAGLLRSHGAGLGLPSPVPSSSKVLLRQGPCGICAGPEKFQSHREAIENRAMIMERLILHGSLCSIMRPLISCRSPTSSKYSSRSIHVCAKFIDKLIGQLQRYANVLFRYPGSYDQWIALYQIECGKFLT